MKLDLNNIDDIFKEGLEDFTEQPSPGLWNKISGKMFWDDLAHFRFGNITRLWIGVSVGLLFVAAFFSVWNMQDGDGKILEVEQVESVQATLQILEDQSGEQDIMGKDFDIQKLTIDKNVEPLAIDEKGSDLAPNPELVSASQNTQAINTKGQRIGLNQQITLQNSEISIEKPVAIAQSKLLNNESNVEIDQDNDRDNVLPAATLGIAAVATTSTPTEESSRIAGNIQMQTGRNTTLGKVSNPKKMKTINPLSLSTGPIIDSKYKAPKREFQDQLILGYQNYQPYFSLSTYFAPEFTEYFRVASESRERSYSGGLALSYMGQRYMVQAGIEYSATQDLGDYIVNLNSYDSIGFYNGISGFEIIPGDAGEDSLLYNYHTVEVWDTLQHNSHQQTNNNYSYLQVPLMFGYKAMESGVFTAYIKAGPNFSFLLNRQEQVLNYQVGTTARITGIDNFTAPRLTTNVQILVSIALQFQFSQRFGLLVEPTYRYYPKSVYDINGQTLKNSYGIGIRGGLFYNF